MDPIFVFPWPLGIFIFSGIGFFVTITHLTRVVIEMKDERVRKLSQCHVEHRPAVALAYKDSSG
jgi:hypothetical protein